MSYEKTTEDLHTSVGELISLMNDTFTCCMRNYEALLPYLEKKETKPKIYHKLLQVNLLLNKLNEELVGLRVEYLTVSSQEQKRDTVLSEGRRKRRMSDVSEVGRCEAKSIKMEVPLSSNTKCLVTQFSETAINMKSENFLSIDTEETKHAQVQQLHIHCAKNIKSEKEDSDKVVDLLELTRGNSDIPAAQTLSDTINIGMTVHVAGGEENASVAERLVGDNACHKPADTVKQRENDEEHVPLQNVESEINSKGKFEGSGNILSEYHEIERGLRGEDSCTTSFSYQAKRPFNCKELPGTFTAYDKEPTELVDGRGNRCTEGGRRGTHFPMRDEKDAVPVQRSEEQRNAENRLYGVVMHANGTYRCTLCDREFCDYIAVNGHVRGKSHKTKRKIAKKKNCATESKVLNNSCESTPSVPLCSAVASLPVDTVPSNNCESTSSVSVCPDVACSLAGGGGEENASVAERLVGGSGPLQNVESETSSQEICEDSGNVVSKYHNIEKGLRGEDGCTTSFSYQTKRPFYCKESPGSFTTYDKEPAKLVDGREKRYTAGERRAHSSMRDKDTVPVQRSVDQCNAEGISYGVIRHDNGRYRCTLCDRDFYDYNAVHGHVKGKRHKIKRENVKKNNCAKEPEISNKSCESTASVSVCPAAACSLADNISSNNYERVVSVSVCSDLSCSLADTVAIVEDTHHATTLVHAVRLEDMWTKFHSSFHINKKFFMVHSGKVVCLLCNEKIGAYILDVKTHIFKLTHCDRINVFQNIELANRSSKKRLLNIPGILKNIIPRSQFSLRHNGFFCCVCKCFCANAVVLSHMTGADHGKKLEETKKSV